MNVERSYSSVRRVIIRGTIHRNAANRRSKAKYRSYRGVSSLDRPETGQLTPIQLRDANAPNVTVRRVQQLLECAPDLRWARAVTAPCPTTTTNKSLGMGEGARETGRRVLAVRYIF